ncbi:unnamed protein product [Anisakis simplex]|uniref:FHA domain-containing protein n=1 Tax=Anisakis simplex TaxID=6269 RepID=A0A0M3J963_ANISI|nr:unnamed protein product [Anisakis simplex]
MVLILEDDAQKRDGVGGINSAVSVPPRVTPPKFCIGAVFVRRVSVGNVITLMSNSKCLQATHIKPSSGGEFISNKTVTSVNATNIFGKKKLKISSKEKKTAEITVLVGDGEDAHAQQHCNSEAQRAWPQGCPLKQLKRKFSLHRLRLRSVLA